VLAVLVWTALGAANARALAPSVPAHPLDLHRAEMEYRAMLMRDENGKIPENALLTALSQKQNMTYDARLWQAPGATSSPAKSPKLPTDAPSPVAGISTNGWVSIGPGNIGGRVRSIVINPTNTSIMFLGSVGGGVWKTVNGGASWFPLNDFMANLAIGCLVMDPTNPNVIYAGTGEGEDNIDALQGAGIFKTTDGGVTWTQLPATANASFYYVNRLALCPTNNLIILAATESGIWRSTDAGTTWNQQYSAETVLDIAFNPATGASCIASGTPFTTVALYSLDAGITWNSATGLPAAGRVEVAYAASSPNLVYAGVDNNSGEVYLSTDGGQTYSLQNTGNQYLGGQGWYDNCIWVDPTNPNVVVVGGLDIWRSTDGGVTFTDIGGYTGEIHPDQHAIVSVPNYNGSSIRTVYIGDDGGIFQAADIYSASSSSGWTTLNNKLGITQFYGAAGNNTSGTIVGGTQDNGTPRFTPTAGSNAWSTVYGGDGGFCAADPTDTNYFYGEYVYLDIFRSANAGASANDIYSGIGDAGVIVPGSDPDGDGPKGNLDSEANFIAPFILDPNNPNTLLAGGSNLWRSANAKATTPTWSIIKAGIASGSYLNAIAVAPGKSDLIWVGHNSGAVYYTTNGTSGSPTWYPSGSGTLPARACTRLAVDPNNVSIVYACFGGYSSGNVYKTVNGGATWSNIGAALPNVPVRSLVIAPLNSSYLYVGTDIGVFASADGGATWSTGNEGAANAAVDELFWMGNTLVAATHGRGLFKIAVITDSLQITPGSGFGAIGTIGRPFSNTNLSFVLTNIGSSSFNWGLGNTSAWLQVSLASGTLAPGGAAATVAVSLSAAATNLAVGNYAATITFTNLGTAVVQYRQFSLQVQDPFQISPVAGLTFTGIPGGVAGASQSFALTNASASAINWSLANTSSWVAIAPTGGALAGGGGGATVTVTVTAAANALAIGSYTNNVWFTNMHDGVVQVRPLVVVVQPLVLNGGFETGDFSYWTESGNFTYCSVSTGSSYVHSGRYGAAMGPGSALGYLSQTLNTKSNQLYLLSFWLNSPDGQTPNEFTAAWNGTTLVDQVNLGVTGWVNLQYPVLATSASTLLQFGFRDDPTYLGFDDVTVNPIPPAAYQSVKRTGSNFGFTWSAQPSVIYQLQFATNLVSPNWVNLGGQVTATSNSVTLTDTNPLTVSPARFYRLQMFP